MGNRDLEAINTPTLNLTSKTSPPCSSRLQVLRDVFKFGNIWEMASATRGAGVQSGVVTRSAARSMLAQTATARPAQTETAVRAHTVTAMPLTTTTREIRAKMEELKLDEIAEYFRQDEGDNEDRAPYEACDGVSVEAFNKFVGDGEGLVIGLRFLELSPDGRILIVDLPTLAHETTVRDFEFRFLNACGDPYAVSKKGSMTAHRGGHPDKEADATYGPLPRTPNRTGPPAPRTIQDWIAVAVEVGRSQTWASLQDAALWWYGYVGIEYILLIKISAKGYWLDYRLYDVPTNLLNGGNLPNVATTPVRTQAGLAATVVFDTRRVLSIPNGRPLPANMPAHTIVDMQAIRNMVVQSLRG